MDAAVRPEGAVSALAIHETLVDDGLNGVSSCHARHTKSLAQLSIGWHAAVRVGLACELAEVVGDFLVPGSCRHRGAKLVVDEID